MEVLSSGYEPGSKMGGSLGIGAGGPRSLSFGVGRFLPARNPSPRPRVTTIAYRSETEVVLRFWAVSPAPVSGPSRGRGWWGRTVRGQGQNARASSPADASIGRGPCPELGATTGSGAVPSTSINVFWAHAGRSLLILRNASVAASASSRTSEVRRWAPRRVALLGKKRRRPCARESSWILESLGRRRGRKTKAPCDQRPLLPGGRRRSRTGAGQGRCTKDEH